MSIIKNVALIAFFALTMVACKSDDDNNDLSNQELLIGNFQLSSATFNGMNQSFEDCEDLSTLMITEETLRFTGFDGDNCEDSFTDVVVYTATDNTITITDDSESVTINYTISSNTLVFSNSDEGEIFTQTYTRL